MPPLDPIVSEFASTEDEAAHDAWLRAEIQASLDDDSPVIPHDEVMAELKERIAARRAEQSGRYDQARLAG